MRLHRLSTDPVLVPSAVRWESAAVFNPALAVRGRRLVMLYRASDLPFGRAYDSPYVSAIGYAESSDGINWERRPEPVLRGEREWEARGPEDPRLTRIGGRWHMVYTAFGGRFKGDFRLALAKSRDLVHWGRRVALSDPGDKDGALLEAGGRLWLIRRPDGRSIAVSRRDGPEWWLWSEPETVMAPRPGHWDSVRLGIGPAPVRVPEGWLLIYHGVDERNVYRLGAALLDAEDPRRVLWRQEDPVLEPELGWERDGLIPNVVFACGAVDLGDRILVAYGAADTVVGMAELPKHEIRFGRLAA